MNKVNADLIRTVLKVGGAILATVGVLPQECGTSIMADPAIPAIVGTLLTIGGTLWGIVTAQHHEELKQETTNDV